MSRDKQNSQDSSPTRRSFLKTTAAGAAAIGAMSIPRMAHADGNDTLKIGLVGCGGRGSGAAANALKADPNTKLVAMADLFKNNAISSRDRLAGAFKQRVECPDDMCFDGFDGYKKVIAADTDVILLATPPYFRPVQLRAAVEAGKHIFCEKPVAVDAPGVRDVFETVKMAKDKNLNLVSGLCWRYDAGVRDTIARIKEGMIGDIRSITETYLTGTLWHRGRKPEWSELEYQCQNWLYFTWLSGDHNTEQHVHSLDKALWLNDDMAPVRCFGLGGRQVRTEEQFGNVYDHHAVCYEFPNDVMCHAYTRQMHGCYNDVDDYVLGTKGKARVLKKTVEPLDGDRWRSRARGPSMYDQEHIELFQAIRGGNPINDGDYMTKSTMMAIMGRMAEYTGKALTWEEALNSQEKLGPENFDEKDFKPRPIAMPGVTKFA